MPGCDVGYRGQRRERCRGFPPYTPAMTDVAYLDHAATTPVRPEVRAAMEPFLTEVYGNPSGVHSVARRAKTALEEAREEIAAALGCLPGEVVVTGGGSEADNLAVIGGARMAARAGLPRRVVVSAIEHKAVSEAAHRLEPEGVAVRIVGVGSDGIVDLDDLAAALAEPVALVSVMLVNNEVGTIQPLAEIADLVRTRSPGARLHTDAVQSVQ